MSPPRRDVVAMVGALFGLIGSLDRATRRSKGASTLSLLQVLGEGGSMRPSHLAERQRVHPSLVTRQLHELERMGFVRAGVDPDDARSHRVRLTAAGRRETFRLREIGIDRFAQFVDAWPVEEVRTLTSLLVKLRTSKGSGERRRGGAVPRPPA